MFRQYALDPAAISDWQRARYFLDAFGPWKGRFLVEYPRKWKKMVHEGLSCPTREKHRITEKLSHLDRRAFIRREGSAYDGSKAWLENALAEHDRSPFDGVISDTSTRSTSLINANDVDDEDPRWVVHSGRLVERDPAAFAEAVALLLRVSSTIKLVDPYFRADQLLKRQAVAALCRVNPHARLEVHASDEHFSYDQFRRAAERSMPTALPRGTCVACHSWDGQDCPARLHNRYILTDVGGVQFGDGIETGARGHQDRLSILGRDEHRSLLEQYDVATSPFSSAGEPFEVQGR